MFNFSVNTVPADGLAPKCARPSAGTVMTQFESHIYLKGEHNRTWTPGTNTNYVITEFFLFQSV